jgi:hypothetical protein
MKQTGWPKKKKPETELQAEQEIGYTYEVDSTGSRNSPVTVCVMSVMNTEF